MIILFSERISLSGCKNKFRNCQQLFVSHCVCTGFLLLLQVNLISVPLGAAVLIYISSCHWKLARPAPKSPPPWNLGTKKFY